MFIDYVPPPRFDPPPAVEEVACEPRASHNKTQSDRPASGENKEPAMPDDRPSEADKDKPFIDFRNPADPDGDQAAKTDEDRPPDETVTTLALGEEGGDEAVREEPVKKPQPGRSAGITTMMIGEEGGQ